LFSLGFSQIRGPHGIVQKGDFGEAVRSASALHISLAGVTRPFGICSERHKSATDTWWPQTKALSRAANQARFRPAKELGRRWRFFMTLRKGPN
jgi:hypothetical protein